MIDEDDVKTKDFSARLPVVISRLKIGLNVLPLVKTDRQN